MGIFLDRQLTGQLGRAETWIYGNKKGRYFKDFQPGWAIAHDRLLVIYRSAAFENAAGSVWTFLPLIPRINQGHASLAFSKYLSVTLQHLGYPQYFRYILGPWQFACAAALLAPGLPRIKEWAYAGAFFNYWAAFLSHQFAGDPPDFPALVMATLAVGSWALRPRERCLANSIPVGKTSRWSWLLSAVTLAVLLILSLLWLPQPKC